MVVEEYWYKCNDYSTVVRSLMKATVEQSQHQIYILAFKIFLDLLDFVMLL